MIPHALLGFYRNLARHKLYGALNILGLAVGIAVFLVLALLTRYEYGYDRWLSGVDQIYRIDSRNILPGMVPFEDAGASFVILDLLRSDYPQIAAGTRLMGQPDIVSTGGSPSRETVMYVDPDFLRVFALPLLRGDPSTALAAPDRVLLSRAMARRLFGTGEALGRSVQITHMGEKRMFTVSGILADLPDNRSIDFDIVAPFSPLVRQGVTAFHNWGSTSGEIFLRIPRPEDARAIAAGLPAFVHRRAAGGGNDKLGDHPENGLILSLVPMRSVHFRLSNGGFKPAVDRRVVDSLGLIGVLALLMAAINYVNLATARAGLRAREVAVRKVLGGTRRSLLLQFLAESVALALVAALIGLALAEIGIPVVDALGGWSIAIDYSWVLTVLACVVLLVGLGAGLYPAVLLAGYRPAAVLASSRMPSGGRLGGQVRTLLVLAQFASAIGIAGCTLVIDAQARFLRDADRGFDRQGLVIIKSIADTSLMPRQMAIMDALRRVPGVEAATLSDREPDSSETNRVDAYLTGHADRPFNLVEERVGYDYDRTYHPRLLAGRWFDDAHRQDDIGGQYVSGRTISTVLNRAALSNMGFHDPAAAVGQVFYMDGATGRITLPIIGVVEDVRFASPRLPVDPQAYIYDGHHPIEVAQAAIRYAGVPRDMMMRRLADAWHAVVPEMPFVADTADERLADFYRPDGQRARLFSIGSGIAMAIACVGLYGLAAFSTARRTREIGIRKVLGASTSSVLSLLVGQFLRPVLIAGLFACPVAFIAMSRWLAGFDQRIALSPGYFLGALFAALALATLTVLAQAIRVARAEPSRALRDA